MKALLEFIVQYCGFLYLNPGYRITNSATRGLADIDASITFTGEEIGWQIINDRGLIYFAAAPSQGVSDDSYALSLIRQYLERGEDVGAGPAIDEASWLSANLSRIERLFTDESNAARVCDELADLRRSNSFKKWGWPKPEETD
ncbi:hypothetical protein [Mycobacterium avium]|uniref:hypothetical protein n=1 Tax=Mycobacterium avium TaxID=1764 RepID=UPI0003F728EC|nr:hypothetical protein [Mycobacterium avium]AYJ03396.1 hypothetical protein DBO90_00185 [Mycobacterium avium]MDV3267545.1 hypothetical protein [Mycobacterium avium]QGW30601.1 hypothetical protein MAA44156_00337 [Mycobacterium avium subsp. avium]UEA19414.1 hypothetical protein LK460_20035 [Mycobacterium avium subsp. avium]UEA33479.1 hypothetical protein LK466_17640 [Mycobacterium avium subsp. avium]